MKLDKQDKKILIWGFIIGTILNLFIDKDKRREDRIIKELKSKGYIVEKESLQMV